MSTLTLRPTGDGDLLECSVFPASPTTHYDKVDEETTDEDTTYLYNPMTSIGLLSDLFTTPASGLSGVTINSVIVWMRNRGLYDSAYQLVKTHGTVYPASVPAGPSSYTDDGETWATNPNTGIAWTIAEVDAMQIGVKIECGSTTQPSRIGRCTQVWVIINYSNVPTVTTEAVSDIAATTATGNGTITALGADNPTEHGHCWSTSSNPTTSDSKTTKGAASATGAFISEITGLTAGTLYHTRAYATNTDGTGYGTDVTWTAQSSGAPPPGNIAVIQTRLQYVDAYGKERYILGTLV